MVQQVGAQKLGGTLPWIVYIYTLLYNVNIVMLLDANSIDTKNLKGVDSVGFPDSAITPRRVYKIGCLYTIRQSE